MEDAECIHHVGVVPVIGPPTDVFYPFDWSHQRRSIQTRASDGVVRVGNSQNPSAKGDDIPLKACRVASTIPALMVVPDDGGYRRERRVLRDHVRPNIRVAAHYLPLLLVQWSRFVQDVISNADLSKIV